ncbi:MAG: hypothetical protein ACRDVL_09665 [Acidimicrobiia bacterium]
MRRGLTGIITIALLLSAAPAMAGGQSDLAEARLATARFHKVAHAEAAGYGSTLDTLGCFQNPGVGGMGLHYLDGSLLDATVDEKAPEALVYEMRDDGTLELVALEYIVPIAAWNEEELPSLFGQHFHAHPVLPLYVLHAWIWRPNPLGMFQDWNPNVAMCPEGVPIFGA